MPRRSIQSPRQRLAPEVRAAQILDAALAEFSHRGFAATRMEDIASRAGLSKGSLYVHFANKEDIFEALLDQLLKPSFNLDGGALFDPQAIGESVAAFIDHLYTLLSNPHVMALIRMLMTDGVRVAPQVRRWRAQMVQPYLDEQQRYLDDYVERRLLRRSALTDNVMLLFSPALHALTWQLVFGSGANAGYLSAIRTAHQQLLLEQLIPPTLTH